MSAAGKITTAALTAGAEPDQDPSNFVTVQVCLPCDDDDHDNCYGGLCGCYCTRHETPSCGCGGDHWSCPGPPYYGADPDEEEGEDDE